MKVPSGQRGLTLVELILAITIIGIVAAFASPSLSPLIEKSQRRAVINDTMAMFAMARQEAVLGGRVVTICPLNSDNRCGRDWSKPVTLFYDPKNLRKVNDAEQIIRVVPPPKRGELKVRSLSRSYFQYRANGRMYSDLGNITWCPDIEDTAKAAHFIVPITGKAWVTRDTDGDGYPEDSGGQPVRC